MHVGSPSCGMNAAVRSFVRNCIYRGDKVYGVCDGVMGLEAGKVKLLDWSSVTGWVAQGGAYLGTKRAPPKEDQLPQIAARIKELGIQALLVIGGFEGYQTCLSFLNARNRFSEFKIPIAMIPATISNNVPGTEFSLGCDTALNEITEVNNQILNKFILFILIYKFYYRFAIVFVNQHKEQNAVYLLLKQWAVFVVI